MSDYLKHSSHYEQQNIYMGLNNKICTKPTYYCRLHQVYLSDEDVKNKKCLCKMSADMLSVKRCDSLIEYDKYYQEQQEYSHNKRRKNNYNVVNTSTYKKTVKRLLQENKGVSYGK